MLNFDAMPRIEIDDQLAGKIESDDYGTPVYRECPACACPRLMGEAGVWSRTPTTTTWRIYLNCGACERDFDTGRTFLRPRMGSLQH